MTTHNIERLINIKTVESMTGFGQSFIYQMVKDKRFPAPVKIVNSSRWVESEVQEWIQEKLKSRE